MTAESGADTATGIRASGPDIPTLASPAQSVRVGVRFHREGRSLAHAETDLVSVEEPLEIRLDYRAGDERVEQALSVTMRTPGNDFDLAIGFLLSEGVIQSGTDVIGTETCGPPSPDKGLYNTVKVTLADHVNVDTQSLTRYVYTSSSCGVCGKASLDAVHVQIPDGERDAFRISADDLKALPAALRAKQTEFDRTGGLHASACFDAEGNIDRLREDVGRHNALDKLIGSYLAVGEPPLANRAVLLSGRASFELMQKAAMTSTAFVAAIGPPSSLAVELAVAEGITLVGFLKAGTFNVYAGAERIT